MAFFRSPLNITSNDDYYFLMQLNLTAQEESNPDQAKLLHDKAMQEISSAGLNKELSQNRLTFFRNQESVTEFLKILCKDKLEFGKPLYNVFGGHYRGPRLSPVYLVHVSISSDVIKATPAAKMNKDLCEGALSVLRGYGYQGEVVNLQANEDAELNGAVKIKSIASMGKSFIKQLTDPSQLRVIVDYNTSTPTPVVRSTL